ncbi:MAG: hypothetical protein H7838_13850 [Magnetococcus sp. DMHC-8]
MHAHWYNRLSGRERILVWMVATATLLAGWYRVVWLPFFQEWQALENRLAGAARSRVAGVVVGQGELPWLEEAKRWVPAKEVTGLLNRLARPTGGLQPVGLEVRPPRLLLSCEQGLTQDGGAGALFRHDLILTLEGSYPAVLTYLHRLEGISWRIHLDRLDYTVHRTARPTLLLHVHFLSLGRSLFAD